VIVSLGWCRRPLWEGGAAGRGLAGSISCDRQTGIVLRFSCRILPVSGHTPQDGMGSKALLRGGGGDDRRQARERGFAAPIRLLKRGVRRPTPLAGLRWIPCSRVCDHHVLTMTNRRLTSPFALPMMMARLTAASLETIFHRTTMMAKGTCSPAEYQRMVAEKATAAQRSMMALTTGKSPMAVLAPYSSRARANARRLRRGQ
jgi:hypothetical protein